MHNIEHQSLIKDSTQRQWLDGRIKSKLLERVAISVKHLKHARQALQAFVDDQINSQDQSDWMRGELTRLTPLNWQHGLHETLSKEVDAGQQLQQYLRPYLDHLGMKGGRLDIQLHAQEHDAKQWHEHCWDVSELLVSSSLGEPFRKLSGVASSGGELSRFALALKASGTFALSAQTAVFNEVDVGGETGWCVAELLARMEKNRQVFVVSHLPQVAPCAQHQISILKSKRDGRTMTDLAFLKPHERPADLARMFGSVNGESLEHAQQMLHKAITIQQGQMCLIK
ncbi:MAG: hypothetical protein Q9M15_03365 [Mariprofundaceae bacterium]|nr:hypothetical protein [Mariprofundaceae bacterium]